MAKLTLRQAAEVFDVSRPTLSKALSEGKISGEKIVEGKRVKWLIEKSELLRVYQIRESLPGKGTDDLSMQNSTLAGKAEPSEQVALEDLRRQLADAEKRAAVAEAQAEEKQRFIDELRKDKEDMRRLLPAPEASGKRKGWWPFG